MKQKNVVISFLGSTLDYTGVGKKRWERWRPSVSITMHDDLIIDQYYIMYHPKHQALMDQIKIDIETVSPETEVIPVSFYLKDPWDFEEVYTALLDFIKKTSFNPDQNRYLIHITNGTHVAQICLFLLTESRHFPGQLLQSSPGVKRELKGSYAAIDLDLSRYDSIADRFREKQQEDLSLLKSGIPTKNRAFNEMIEAIGKVALRSREPILLTGPTGAGKSHLAKQIYTLKKDRFLIEGVFVEVNCATLRGDAAISTLFGHKRGAFTGALSDRDGLLKSADGGILFLDEIGELGLDEQAMLLRAIEEKRFMPMGADQETESDFQLICGTNRDLKSEVDAGNFREDLLARIDLWSFCLPGLAQRQEDIEPNIDYELLRYANRYQRHIRLNKEARTHFLKFSSSSDAIWSANFRDLNGAITRMATLADYDRITVNDVKEEQNRLMIRWKKSDPNQETLSQYLSSDHINDIDLFDQPQLLKVIEVCLQCHTLSEAGRILFSASRKQKKSSNDGDRLRKYLKKFNLDFNDLTLK